MANEFWQNLGSGKPVFDFNVLFDTESSIKFAIIMALMFILVIAVFRLTAPMNRQIQN